MTPSHKQRLIDVDPQTAALIAAEERRQREKIILIPSESLTPEPIREALGSAFTSVYAEGYPRKAMTKCSPEELADLDVQLASYRRYADRRFYKGAELADIVESLAGRRAAECFATDEVPASIPPEITGLRHLKLPSCSKAISLSPSSWVAMISGWPSLSISPTDGPEIPRTAYARSVTLQNSLPSFP